MNYDDLNINGIFPVPDLLLHEHKQRRDSLLLIHIGSRVFLITQLYKREKETGRRLSGLISIYRRQKEGKELELLDRQIKSSVQCVYTLFTD